MNLRSIKTNKEEVTQIRKNILSLICLYSNNTSIGKGLSSLYEIYLPRKIIDNLFHLKDVNEHSLTKWLDTRAKYILYRHNHPYEIEVDNTGKPVRKIYDDGRVEEP